MAKLTLKETFKEKVFPGTVAVNILLCVFSYYLSEVSSGDTTKVAMDFILTFQFFLTVIFAILLTAGSFSEDIRHKAIYLIYSKPVTRKGYILGKLAGLCSAVAVLSFLFYLINTTAVLIINVLARLYTPHIVLTERMFLFSLLCALAGVLAVALTAVFSLLHSTALLAMVSSFLLFLAGLEVAPVKELVVASKLASPFNKLAVKVAYYILPNFSFFNLKVPVVHHFVPVPVSFLLLAFAYFLCYFAFLTAVAMALFEGKEL